MEIVTQAVEFAFAMLDIIALVLPAATIVCHVTQVVQLAMEAHLKIVKVVTLQIII